MKHMNSKNVEIVRSALKGAKLAKFDASIAVLNESLAQGNWISRGSIKARSGFYQGISNVERPRSNRIGDGPEYGSKEYRDLKCADGVSSLLRFGGDFKVIGVIGDGTCFSNGTDEHFKTGVAILRKHGLKLSDEVIYAWKALCEEFSQAEELLDEGRPVPKITPIGLSPKVTKTLKECNLDLDLPSIKMAEIDFEWVPMERWDDKSKQFVALYHRDGRPKMMKRYFVKWTPGIKHNRSRFVSGCQACGKHIPSGLFVAVEAKDKRSGDLISMWLGCDCAANIFGIKDVGVEKE